MDTRAPFDDPEWAPASLADSLEQRLAAIEDRLDAIEGSLRSEIAQDLRTASEEMRRSVSELGRLLLRDLDRLTRVLGEHRDEIVDRLTAAPAVVAAPPPVPGAAPPETDYELVEPSDEPEPLTGEAGRWRVPSRKRKRPPQA